MDSGKKEEKKIARRGFLKGAAVGAAGLAAGALSGCGPGATPAPAATPQVIEKEVTKEVKVTPWLPEKWDLEAEVVIVGYGGAGAVTAITAYDAGAKVLVLEKLPDDTPTRILHTCSTRFSASCTLHFLDKQHAIDYLKFSSRGATPDDVIEAWAEYATHTKDWLEGIGCELTGTDQPVPSEFVDTFAMPGDNYYYRMFHAQRGEGLWQDLNKAVRERDIELMFESPVKELVQDAETKEILGVVAEQGGKKLYVKATKGVVLSCGGFEFDFELLDTYVWAHPCRFYDNPGNTGDGVRMAQAVGAQLWHMPLIGGRVIAFFPEINEGMNAGTWSPYLHVTKYGKRFLKMPWHSHSAVWDAFYWDRDICDFPAVPCWSVFDQSSVDKKGALFGAMKYSEYVWSEDNSVEIEKGWILKADTIEELAQAIARDPENGGKMKPEVLAATISQYNEYCANGEDPELGSDPSTLLPLQSPPFYAVKLYPGGVNTFGGPKRSPKSEIVNSFGQPIPRLYGVGELGSILGFLYSGGGWNICEVIVSGQVAGKNVVALEPWA